MQKIKLLETRKKQHVEPDRLTNSQSLNRYSYVQGNPVSYTDPFGLSPYNGNTISGHGVLDALGLVPVFGNAADLINAGAYALEGNTTESLKYVLFATAFGGAAAAASKAGKAVRGAGAVEKAAEAKRFCENCYRKGEG